jgi:uncharacterized membrane protein
MTSRREEGERTIPQARRTGAGADGEDPGARVLGWLSVGLGLAQVTAPGAMSRLIGAPDHDRSRRLMRTVGMRELGTGIGILTQPDPAPWVQARVVGDLMDLALLGTAFRSPEARTGRLAGTAVAVLGVGLVDAVCSQRLRAVSATRDRAVHVARAITVKKSPDEVYAFWRDLANLPRFMAHLAEVQPLGELRSRWTATAPAGMRVSWEAEIVEDREDELLEWCSLPGADVPNWGRVSFREAPRGRGTEILVELHYEPPAGSIGVLVAKLFGEEPAQQVADDLHRLKQVLEVGEVVLSDAAPEGRGRPFLAQHAAKPGLPAKKGGRP